MINLRKGDDFMAQAGLSTNGITFSYGVGANSKDGAKPETMTLLDRINAIGGISITDEVIDSSALEDKLTRNIKGRGDTGGSTTVTVNLTDETLKEWKAVIQTFNDLSSSQGMWFQTIIPGLSSSFWFIAEPPSAIPQPEFGQNQLLTVEMNMTIADYVGDSDPVEPAANPVISGES